MSPAKTRIGLVAAFAFALLPLLGGYSQEKKPDDKIAFYHGKVLPLADLLAKANTKIDADVSLLILQSDDGKIYPLLKDDGSRMFFKDAKLLNRPMRLNARLIRNSQILQVINVHSVVKGNLHEVYYWCDICTIKRFEAGICDCCGDPMVFREELHKGD